MSIANPPFDRALRQSPTRHARGQTPSRFKSWLRPVGQLAVLVLIATSVPACQREPNVKDGLGQLQQAFPDPASVPPAVQLALDAARTNELGQGVVALQNAKAVPGLSADQLQTMEQASQSLTRELLRRAESGDARAKADLELIERFRSQ